MPLRVGNREESVVSASPSPGPELLVEVTDTACRCPHVPRLAACAGQAVQLAQSRCFHTELLVEGLKSETKALAETKSSRHAAQSSEGVVVVSTVADRTEPTWLRL